jgi:hypothetical protein
MRKKQTSRGFIENTCRITLQSLKEAGMLRQGIWKAELALNWTGCTIHVDLETCIDQSRPFSVMILYYRSPEKNYSDLVRLERISLTLGERYYFRCRETGKRVTALYFNGYRFASRYEHGLTYRACREHRQWYENFHRYIMFEGKCDKFPRYSERKMAYAEKSLKYVSMMAEDFDRRFS